MTQYIRGLSELNISKHSVIFYFYVHPHIMSKWYNTMMINIAKINRQ